MSEPIQNNAIKNLQNIQKMRSESMQEYHKKVDEQAHELMQSNTNQT